MDTSPPPTAPSESRDFTVINYLRGIAGAVIGGAIALLVFRYLYQNNLYAPLILGGGLGLGASLLSGSRSMAMGGICLVLGGALTLVGDWSVEWFTEDDSFLFYLKNLTQLGPIRLVMLALSTLAAGYFGTGR